ncbi:unnamed protein product [Didymodactylos carnosus]|uniref:Uncharacterized protein n=1 Tax=Didymodactylos carnosus TaxID=1234261 RepID=A0A816EB26_9BILA|nr:unnamed protein product [Didymodactylos carnosus]CAF4569630.1 unnamed protein product [Didymodactylos carnosus]
MPSTLLSTSCYIKTKPYYLRICIDDDPNEVSVSTIDDILLTIGNCESTSNTDDILNSIRLHLESLTDKKENSNHDNDDTIPETIILSKLLNIEQTKPVKLTKYLYQNLHKLISAMSIFLNRLSGG